MRAGLDVPFGAGAVRAPILELHTADATHKAKFVGRSVRAEGNLVHGTLVERDQPCE
jgi:hypothetical protein